MNFYIKKLHIWFKPGEKRRTIQFINNKVNIITGSSSRGKSNILAIIDYCLLSTKPRIVYPVINEYAEWYGIEFEANGKSYAIARKKPTEDIAESNIYRQFEEFTEDFYPRTSNIQISDLRRELDLAFSLKEEYREPHVEGVENPRVSFRSFLIFNALTETIMTSPHLFSDYNFFDKGYVDVKPMRDYLFDVVLGLDNIQQSKKIAKVNHLNKIREEIDKNTKDIKKYTEKFNNELLIVKKLFNNIPISKSWKDESYTPEQWIIILENVYKKNEPFPINGNSKELIELRDKLNYLVRLRDNINEARKEINSYLIQKEELIDSLKPVKYLKDKFVELGGSYWTSRIIDAFEKALNEEEEANRSTSSLELIQKDKYENLLLEIKQTEESIRIITQRQELPETQRQEFFYVIGRIKSHIEELKKLAKKIPQKTSLVFTKEQELEFRNLTNDINNFYPLHNNAIDRLNEVFQTIYDEFNYMEYYQKFKTKYSVNDERLMLNRGISVYNEENIGSQSNYMFLHLCYFLGLHKYMIDINNPYVGQFIFIDQPSIPYYAGSDNVKTTDKEKLLDAFEAINRFMHYVIDEKRSQFQIIMIEHAPESYWIDEETGLSKKNLDYFITTEKFEGDNALIPIDIINSRNKVLK